MNDSSFKRWSAPLPIRVQSMVGVLMLATSALAVLGLLFSAGTLLLSAVTVPGVVFGVVGVLGAKVLVSFLAGMARRVYEDGAVDPSAMFRAVDRMVAPALGREAVNQATVPMVATSAVPTEPTAPIMSTTASASKALPASTLSRTSAPPPAPAVASLVRARVVTETEQRVA